MAETMPWYRTNRADPRAARLADKHYSRQTVGARQFSMPGRLLVLLTAGTDAVWASQWPRAEFVRRAYFKDAWVCTLFRREPGCPVRASTLIARALAATRAHWGAPPADGMITFVDATKVRSTNPGCCFRKAGFESAGRTAGGLIILRLRPERMPDPCSALGVQLTLWPQERERHGASDADPAAILAVKK